MNNKYTVKIKSPILRPGLVIETKCSGKYLVAVVADAIVQARAINAVKKV